MLLDIYPPLPTYNTMLGLEHVKLP
jgi:hypothetical protein